MLCDQPTIKKLDTKAQRSNTPSISYIIARIKCYLHDFTGRQVLVHAWCFLDFAVLCLVAQLCLTLCDPMDCTPLGSSVQAPLVLQARILEWVAMPSSRGIFPTQGSNPSLLHCRRILYSLSHQRSPSMNRMETWSSDVQTRPLPKTRAVQIPKHSGVLLLRCRSGTCPQVGTVLGQQEETGLGLAQIYNLFPGHSASNFSAC